METHQQKTEYVHEAVETLLDEMAAQLPEKFALLGKQDGLRLEMIEETSFQIKVTEPVHTEVQQTIDFIKQHVKPASKAFEAQETRRSAQVKVDTLQKENNHDEQQLLATEAERKVIKIDHRKRKWNKWIPIIAGAVGVADGILSYQAFRVMYSTFVAMIAALAIAMCIFISHLLAVWIVRSKTIRQKLIRFGILCIGSFALFLELGTLRAQALNSTVSISLDQSQPALQPAQVSGFTIAIISEVLFIAVVALAILFHKDQKDCKQEEEYNKRTKKIVELKRAIENRYYEIVRLENEASLISNETRQRYDYAKHAIKRCKSTGERSIQAYKQTYLHIKGNTPSFFRTTDNHSYDEDFQFAHAQKLNS